MSITCCGEKYKDYKKDEFDLLRLKWSSIIMPNDPSNCQDMQIKKVIEVAVNNGEKLLLTMNKSLNRDYLWHDLSSALVSSHVTSNFRNLMEMTKAFLFEGSRLKDNNELLECIISGLDWMVKNRYMPGRYYNNWWDWEIGSPQLLNDIVVLLYDLLTEEQIKVYMDTIEWYVPMPYKQSRQKYTTTGANRVDMCKVVAVRGIIVKDRSKLEMAREALSTVFEISSSGDGFYSDGSFVQHVNIPYTGTYGAVLINALGELVHLLQESSFAIAESNIKIIYDMLIKAFYPLIYKGLMMDMVNGRAISREWMQDHSHGAEIISSILKYYAKFAPEEYRKNYKSTVKYWIRSDTYRDVIDNSKDINFIKMAKELMNDPSVMPSGELIGHYNFSGMDRIVHRKNNFTFGISMYSDRIGAYEGNMNGENKKGFHTGDGMTYLYNGDIGQFSGDFWATVDPYRLPGITVDEKRLQDGEGTGIKSSRTWVGGSVLQGMYGAVGMYLDKSRDLGMSLRAKKSWFMFDDAVVALGAGINSIDGRRIETIIENRKLSDSGDEIFVINGEPGACDFNRLKKLGAASWAHLSGNEPNSNIGYYFPGEAKIKVLREARTGCWKDINSSCSERPITRNYLTMWFDHGVDPIDSKYEYIILPGKSVEQVKEYAKSPDIEIIENSADIQAVKEKKLNITAINFWEDRVTSVDGITCDKAASVMVKIVPYKELEFALSDPTQKCIGTINIEINQWVNDVIKLDERIKVEQLSPTLIISINVNESKGKSICGRFTLAGL